MMKLKSLLIFACILVHASVYSQNIPQTPDEIFDAVSEKNKGIDTTMEMDVTGLTLYELLSSIAEEHKLNVSADPSMNQIIASNFFDVKVRDVFMFLINKYNLDVSYMNNILLFKKQEAKKKKPKPIVRKNIDIIYKKENDFLSVKLKNDTLSQVTEKITELSGKNIILSPKVKDLKISSYIINRPFDQVMEMVCKSNGLAISKDENDFYFIEKDNAPQKTNSSNSQSKKRNSSKRTASSDELEISLNKNGFLKIKAYDANTTEIVMQAADLLGINYFMHEKPDNIKSTLVVNDIDFDDLLQHVFEGSEFSANDNGEFYIIGKQSTKGIRVTELIQLENRTIETVLNTLPSAVKKGIELKEFVELNGFLATGSETALTELKAVIRKLDKVVPLIQIEVLIAEYRKSYDVTTGLQGILAGTSEEIPVTNGLIAPETNVSLNSTSINKLVDAFNGLGIINIGKVTQNFYANLSALEQNSIIKLKSTPKIATLSGHDANVSVGETRYYFEQSNSLINSGVNNNILQSGQYKSTQANLSLNITPHVSKDEHITLDIRVEQSTFLQEGGEGAPPGKATRQFESLIRVRNNEMILLGGLDQFDKTDSGSGVPVLSRIPVIKWFFSSKTKGKSKSKLHVFIKPTVIY